MIKSLIMSKQLLLSKIVRIESKMEFRKEGLLKKLKKSSLLVVFSKRKENRLQYVRKDLLR